MKKIENEIWLIVFALFTILGCIFGGCKEETPNTITKRSEISVATLNGTRYLEVVEIERCQYFCQNLGGHGGIFTHSGTCTNPIHKCKCN